jgi:aldehyde dehydrogenase (NAD+)
MSQPPASQRTPTPFTDPETIPGVVQRLRSTFDTGATRPIEWRQQQLQRLTALARENRDRLVDALHDDFGKPPMEALLTDVAIIAAEATAARKQLKRWTKPERVATPAQQQPGRAKLVREPLGVVLIIAPWNYPVQLLLSPLVGAIAAGNCAVLKPSELTPNTSAALADLVPRYLDPDAVAIVEGAVAETEALLAERFDHVFYTGGGRVGRVVMEAAARHLTPVTLELGGKSPCIVDETANLEVAARRIAWGKFLNAGQTCVAPDYVLVHESREDELVEKLGAAIREFYGDEPKESADYARIVSPAHHERLVLLLKDGEAAVGGGSDAEQRYIAPTVLRRVSPDSSVMREEIFGPILPVLPVADLDEAIRFASAREKPLALYLFSEDADAAERVTRETSSGSVCINHVVWQIANPNLPFGGVGPSGTGAYHGRHSFETFSHRKPVVTKPTRFDPKFAYPPFGRLKTALMKRLL